jgi:uncharacterized protein YciW
MSGHPAAAHQRAIQAITREYEDHLSHEDCAFIVHTVAAAFREPDQRTIEMFIEELDDTPGQHSDPSAAEADSGSRHATRRRLALTYAWRRAMDRLAERGRP